MASFAKNGFLSSLSPGDRRLLEANASVVTLDHGRQIQEQHARIESVYFPLNGIISLLTVMENGTAVESAMISHPQLGEDLRRLTHVRDLLAGLSRESSIDVAAHVIADAASTIGAGSTTGAATGSGVGAAFRTGSGAGAGLAIDSIIRGSIVGMASAAAGASAAPSPLA